MKLRMLLVPNEPSFGGVQYSSNNKIILIIIL